MLIIAVSMGFGIGCVRITTPQSLSDFIWGYRYEVVLIHRRIKRFYKKRISNALPKIFCSDFFLQESFPGNAKFNRRIRKVRTARV